jgi:hypothetical protein
VAGGAVALVVCDDLDTVVLPPVTQLRCAQQGRGGGVSTTRPEVVTVVTRAQRVRACASRIKKKKKRMRVRAYTGERAGPGGRRGVITQATYIHKGRRSPQREVALLCSEAW